MTKTIDRTNTVLRVTLRALLCTGAIGVLTQCADPYDPNSPQQATLQITSDSSLGTVESAPEGIRCGTECSASFDPDTQVTLTATPQPGSGATFVGWSGDCAGSQPSCTLTVDGSMAVTANWMPAPKPQAPVVNLVAPASASNAAAVPLTVTGNNFLAGATVTIGGVSCGNVSVQSATQLTCTLPARAGVCGSQAIVVTNPNTLSGSAANLFRFSGSGFVLGPATNLTTGMSPDHLLVIDLNGDSKLDLLNTNRATNDATVRLGVGNGTFGVSKSYPVGTNPIGMASADVNGDKKPDLITGNYFSDNISVLLNDGNGGFLAAKNFAVGVQPVGVAVGDLNGDGFADLAVANAADSNLSILMGDGKGGFVAKGKVTTGDRPFELELFDFDGDTFLDVVVTNYGEGTISFLKGKNDGTFAAGPKTTVGGNPIGIAVADINSDGKRDVLTANVSGSISVLLGDGKGAFAAAKNTPTNGNTRAVAVGNLDGDSVPDVVVSDSSTNFTVLIGKGDGTFTASASNVFKAGPDTWFAGLGDFNGDGLLDLAGNNINGNTISVFLSQCK